mmetsp:Transcript_31190/g.96535  ORF Transcript_31190/g.96535 Transcript_31190/m.96535 type:complete len:207 (-) Transcript_31190:5-625(-)
MAAVGRRLRRDAAARPRHERGTVRGGPHLRRRRTLEAQQYVPRGSPRRAAAPDALVAVPRGRGAGRVGRRRVADAQAHVPRLPRRERRLPQRRRRPLSAVSFGPVARRGARRGQDGRRPRDGPLREPDDLAAVVRIGGAGLGPRLWQRPLVDGRGPRGRAGLRGGRLRDPGAPRTKFRPRGRRVPPGRRHHRAPGVPRGQHDVRRR